MAGPTRQRQANGTGVGNGPPSLPDPDAENLERVRELLFGPQVGVIEMELRAVERRFGKALAHQAEVSSSALDSLTKLTRSELDALCNSLERERTKRDASDEALDLAISQTRSHAESELSEQAAALGERLDNIESQLRRGFEDEIGRLRDEMTTQFAALTKRLDSAKTQLSGEKVSRTSLAILLHNLAGELDDDNIIGSSVER